MIYVLDTDEIGLVEQRHPLTMQRLNSVLAVEGNEVVTTIVTVGERVDGWLSVCRNSKDGKGRVYAYANLQQAIWMLLSKKWLPFDDRAALIFDQLIHLKKLIGAGDLGIAAITLSVNGNFANFQRVPNLVFEDWMAKGLTT